MHYYLNTWWRWLRRCGYCRGFGVQSPSAYSFIRYVINEHYPYYAYQELQEQFPQLNRREHKVGSPASAALESLAACYQIVQSSYL